MNNSQFNFFTKEWPAVKELINKVEVNANNNPEYCCLNARKTTEFLVQWIYQNDYEIKTEYKAENSLSYLIHNRDFRNVIGQDRLSQFKFIKDLGNRAAHLNKVPPSIIESKEAASELFKICKWFYQRYSSNPSSVVRQTFKKEYLPTKESEALEKIKSLSIAEKLKEVDNLLKESERKQSFIESELIEYKQRVTELIKRNKTSHKPEEDITEDRTRKIYIDHYLIEAGWRKDISWSEEVKVYGMPNNKSAGRVDYVLWGDDGKPLALVEAKRSTIDPKEGQQQAKLYADCLEKEHGQRPIIFLSNGYKHIIWDDLNYPQREIQGFYKKDELEVLIRRRDNEKKLNSIKINADITDRFYQQKAIKSIVDSLEKKKRKALLVMATGTGKTRTIISLCDLLIKSNSIKRVLFLADRTALVNQAEKAFKKHLPSCSTVNLVTNKSGDGRIFISTYPTILNIIDNKSEDNQRRFGVGHFDLVIIDEAHRSIYQKYHSIFEYFDSLLIGLTATPRSEIDRNTYRLFDLEIGKPTEEYGFKDAVKD